MEKREKRKGRKAERDEQKYERRKWTKTAVMKEKRGKKVEENEPSEERRDLGTIVSGVMEKQNGFFPRKCFLNQETRNRKKSFFNVFQESNNIFNLGYI